MTAQFSPADALARRIAELDAVWPLDKPPSAGAFQLAKELRDALGPRGQGLCGIAQINTTPGDLEGNARRICRAMALAEALGLDWLLTPELSLMGYPPRDVIERHPFLVAENERWLSALAQNSGQTRVAVGYVEERHLVQYPGKVGRPYFNSVAVLGDGQILGKTRKLFLPEYHEFEDQRQFQTAPYLGFSPGNVCITAHGRRYALSICEDLWNDPDFFTNPLYAKTSDAEQARDLVFEWRQAGAEALLNLSASPSRSRKAAMKHALLSHTAQKAEMPLLYVNQVGSVDEVSFDGGSCLYNSTGQLIVQAKRFEEQFLIADPFASLRASQARSEKENSPVWAMSDLESESTQKRFDAYDDEDLPRTYHLLCQGIRDYFAKTGFKRALLGLSGGLDSSVVVVLLADALGSENVLGVSMPSRITPEENQTDAESLAKTLSIQFLEIPIGRITESFEDELSQKPLTAWGEIDARSNAADNIQAISRATLLRQLGNEYRALPIATCDKSELYLGYATVNGDMSGALTPLGDVPKTKVRRLAAWLNANRRDASGNPLPACIPINVIEKPSGADLKRDPQTGQLVTAEMDLMPYVFADEIIWRLETLKQSQQAMLSEFFQYEESTPISVEQKQAWLTDFFQRMSRSVFKWFIVPPILLVDGNGSIAKTDYHHPIVAGRISWKGHTDAEMQTLLSP